MVGCIDGESVDGLFVGACDSSRDVGRWLGDAEGGRVTGAMVEGFADGK